LRAIYFEILLSFFAWYSLRSFIKLTLTFLMIW